MNSSLSPPVPTLPTFEQQLGKSELHPVPDFFTDPGSYGRHPSCTTTSLSPGDKLYIPRGGVHWATVVAPSSPPRPASTSVHLTVAFPTSHLSDRAGVEAILADVPALMARYERRAGGGPALAAFSGPAGGGCSLPDFLEFLASDALTAEAVRERVEEGRRRVEASRDKARKEWHEDYLAYDHSGDRGAHVLWRSRVRWLGGRPEGAEEAEGEEGELEVAESIADEVSEAVRLLKAAGGEGFVVEELKRAHFKEAKMDDVSFLLLVKVLAQLWAVEVVG